MYKLLKTNKSFRFFWIAISISLLGDCVDDIAFAQVVYNSTNSTLLTSYVFGIKVVLTIISIIAAVYIDKHMKKRIILFSLFGQVIMLGIFLGIYCCNYINFVTLFIIVTLQGIFSSLIVPAQNSLLVYIVDKEELICAKSSMSICSQIIQISGYAISGLLLIELNIFEAIVFDIISFIIAIVFIFNINESNTIKNDKLEKVSYLNEIKKGYDVIRDNKIIIAIIITTFLGNFAMAPIDALLPAYCKQTELREYMYPVFMLIMTIGNVVGAFILSKFKRENMCQLYAVGFLIGSVGLVLLQYEKYSVFFSASLIGISTGSISVLTSSLLLLNTPRELVARVFSIFKAIVFIASPLGIVLSGYLGEYFRVKNVCSLMGIVLLISSVVAKIMIEGNVLEMQKQC